MARRRWIAAVVVAGLLGTGAVVAVLARHPAGPTAQSSGLTAPTGGPQRAGTAPGTAPAPQPVYLHYYLWWTPQHWKDKLGAAYLSASAATPLPGKLDADGCNPTVAYPKSELVDLPTEGMYDQNQQSTFSRHVDLAWHAGIRGFLVSWQGTGSASQGPTSSGYDSRLELLVRTVDAYNIAHGSDFRLGLAFAAYGDFNRSADAVIGDLTYFQGRYGHDPAFHSQFDVKPLVMWLDSRKFSVATVRAVSTAVRAHLYLVGDETTESWARDADFLDGTSYYWSTENPWKNDQAGATISKLATSVRAGGKRWFAPFIAGYNKQLSGGTCVPRSGTDTLTKIWQVNGASHPDAWFGISWNELVENTYLEPSRAYGTRYLDALSTLIHG